MKFLTVFSPVRVLSPSRGSSHRVFCSQKVSSLTFSPWQQSPAQPHTAVGTAPAEDASLPPSSLCYVPAASRLSQCWGFEQFIFSRTRNVLCHSSSHSSCCSGNEGTLCFSFTVPVLGPQQRFHKGQCDVCLGDAGTSSSFLPPVMQALSSDPFPSDRTVSLQRIQNGGAWKTNHRQHEQLETYLCHTKAPVHGWQPERIQEPNSGSYPLNCSDG